MAVMRVRVYRNLSPQYRKQRAWSLVAEDGPDKGTVIGIVDGAVLKNVTFVVKTAQRERWLAIQRGEIEARDKGKFVHAWASGTLVKAFPLGSTAAKPGADIVPGSRATARINYDPLLAGHFVRQDCKRPVKAPEEVDVLIVTPAGLYANLPRCPGGLSLGFFDGSELEMEEGWF